ncbi:MAG TPA: hypothetical protein DCQ64_01655 [Candidatus Rokubacteria bacterium]|nr:hypothetical protein [Candidatus Rokubacteria bacterium]
MSPDPVVPPPPRPGDIILTRAIAWWDSGQIQRAVWGLVLAVGPVVLDLWMQNALTWRSFVTVFLGLIFVRMGYSRAKAPDVVTGVKAFDAANVAALAVPPVGPKPGE